MLITLLIDQFLAEVVYGGTYLVLNSVLYLVGIKHIEDKTGKLGRVTIWKELLIYCVKFLKLDMVSYAYIVRIIAFLKTLQRFR